MGLVALAVGASALLGDAFPRRRGAFAFVFAVCMLAESVLLITYNEGLPWYIGYGRYDRWGPNGGTVAPYGDVRAELCFDNQTQTLDVRVLGLLTIAPDVTPELARATVNSLVVLGAWHASAAVKAALADRMKP